MVFLRPWQPIALTAFLFALAAEATQSSTAGSAAGCIGELAIALRGTETPPETLHRLIHDVDMSEFIGTAEPWRKLREPFTGERPQGLDAMRRAAEKYGVVTVVPGKRPATPEQVAATEYRYGTKVVYTYDLPKDSITRGKGVALHSGEPVLYGNLYRGDMNPHLGYGLLHANLSKWREYEFANAVQPGIMSESLLAAELPVNGKNFFTANKEALDGVRISLTDGKDVPPLTASTLTARLQAFFDAANKRFPEGAFLKQIDEAGTADYGGLITSFNSNPDRMVANYVQAVAKIRKMPGFENMPANSPRFLKKMINLESQEAEFVHKFLFDPKNIMVQRKMNLAKTPLGAPMEFRVDFMDGEAVRSLARHTSEYLPEQAAAAEKALNEFFKKAPKEYRYLSGGADVAFTADGTPVIIEFNFGAESWFIMPSYDPVVANLYLSGIFGTRPIIRDLRRVTAKPHEEQVRFLKGLEAKFGKDSLESGCAWIRDRYLSNWLRNPTPETGQVILGKIRSLVQDSGIDAKTADELIKAAEDFVKRRATGPVKAGGR